MEGPSEQIKIQVDTCRATNAAVNDWLRAKPITLQQEDVGKTTEVVKQYESGLTRLMAVSSRYDEVRGGMLDAAIFKALSDPNAAMIERDGAPRAKPVSTTAPAQAQPQRPTPAGLLTLAPITRTGTSFGAWGATED